MVKRSTSWMRLVAGALLAGLMPVAARADCSGPVERAGPASPRPIEAADLIELDEIGFPDGSVNDVPAPVAISPDGRQAAFMVWRADLATNGYCFALVVADLTRVTNPRVIARGGRYASQSATIRGVFANFGTPLIASSLWSPERTHRVVTVVHQQIVTFNPAMRGKRLIDYVNRTMTPASRQRRPGTVVAKDGGMERTEVLRRDVRQLGDLEAILPPRALGARGRALWLGAPRHRAPLAQVSAWR